MCRSLMCGAVGLLCLVCPRVAPGQAAGWSVETLDIPPSHPIRKGAPTWIVHHPGTHADPFPPHWVIFLHGWNGCARGIAFAGQVSCRDGENSRKLGFGLMEQHTRAHTNSLLLIPQLAWKKRTGDAGRFARDGFAREQLRSLINGPLRHRAGRKARPARWSLSRIQTITLVAHSAGFETALAILEHGGLNAKIKRVVLFDALYSGTERFARWLAEEPDRRLLSLHIGRGATARQNRRLARMMRKTSGGEHRLTVTRTRHSHGAIPTKELAAVLRAALGDASSSGDKRSR